MNKHVMIDIETLGTTSDAPILSIGAVVFDPDTGELGSEFYVAVDPSSALAHGTPSGDTLRWWTKRSDEARLAAFSGTQPLDRVLGSLLCWYQDHAHDAPVWANGPSFDIAILETAFRRVGLPIPWPYNAARDCRTIKALAAGLVDVLPSNDGTAHNALDDAVFQANWVSLMWRALRKRAA